MRTFFKQILRALFFWPNKFCMAGTEGTGKYDVWFTCPRGRMGIRVIGESMCRIRVEPRSIFGLPFFAGRLFKELSINRGWKQPGVGGQIRFSKMAMVNSETIGQAVRALLGEKGSYWTRYGDEAHKDTVQALLNSEYASLASSKVEDQVPMVADVDPLEA